MTEKFNSSVSTMLPVKMKLNFVYINTIILMALMIFVSVFGILNQNKIYPGKELSINFISNDICNLTLGLLIIVISMLLTLKGNLAGLLFYPGALFYITYDYVNYLLGLPFNILFIPYLILVIVSIYTIIGLILGIDSEQVYKKLNGYVPIRTAGSTLFVLACLVIIFQLYAIVIALIKQSNIDHIMIAQWIDDLVIASPPFIIIGFLMMRRKALGFTAGVGLLLFWGLLCVGVILIIIFKSVLTNTSIDITGLLVVLASTLIILIPLILFIRGINKAVKIKP